MSKLTGQERVPSLNRIVPQPPRLRDLRRQLFNLRHDPSLFRKRGEADRLSQEKRFLEVPSVGRAGACPNTEIEKERILGQVIKELNI